MHIIQRRAALAILLSFGVTTVHAQASLAAIGTPYAQTFDGNSLPRGSVAQAWVDNSASLPGWYAAQIAGTPTIVDGTGSANSGRLYSYGTGAADTDRALGSIGSNGTGDIFWGVRLQNDTGATITSLDVSYTGEQWRNAANSAQTIAFSYLTGAGALTDLQAAGTAVAALDFTSPVTAGSASALNGNLAVNRSARTATISGLDIAPGAEILLRWRDPNDSGNDHGLAIDDLSVTAHASAPVASANLAVTISDSPDPVAQGGALVYTIVASNAGPDAAANASITLPVPAGVAWNSLSWGGGWNCTGAGLPAPNGPGSFTCTLSGFASGATTTFTLNAHALAGALGPISATATISSSTSDPNPANNSATASTAVIVPVTPIHAIQGSGATSPLVGQTLRTQGVVTGRKGNGFFLQAPDADADADPLTSEGVFVFTGGAPPAAAAVGNLVTVDGKVSEFIPGADPGQLPLTEIGNVSAVNSLSIGNPLPTPVALTASFPDPAGPLDQLERVEGMRVTASSFTVVGPTQGNTDEPNATGTSNGILSAVVTGVPRPFREPGIQAPDTAPGGGGIPPIPRWDFNPELMTVDSDGLGALPLDLSAGAVLTGLVGPLDYGFRRYTVMRDPVAAVVVTPGPSAQPARAPTADEFTVASYNMERFFDTVNDPATSEPVLTPLAFGNRLNKASLAIRDYLNTPDIVAIIEMENLATLQMLASKISADAIAAGQPDPGYVAYLDEGNDVGGIDVGFLAKTAEVANAIDRVEVLQVTQYGKDTTWTEPGGATSLLNDRPPLALDALVHYADGRSFPITAIVVHQRSLNGADGNDANGDRVRGKRQKQAEFVANLIQGMQAANPSRNIIALGDYNAFEFNDGLADAMGTIIGQPSVDAATAVPGDGADLVDPDLVNLAGFEQPGQHYSFVFGGNAQSLDHIVANETLLASADGFAFDHARINADFPEVARNDANSPSRLSDHDPAIAYFLVQPLHADLAASAQATPANVPFGNVMTFVAGVSNAGPDAAAFPGIGFALDAALPDLAVVAPAGWSCDAPLIAAGTTSVACNTTTLALNGSASFSMTAIAPVARAGGGVNLAVVATSATQDPAPADNVATTAVQVQRGADLAISWSGPASLTRGTAQALYRASLQNLGIDPATQARVRLSANALYQTVKLVVPAGWRCTRLAGKTYVADCLASAALAVGSTSQFNMTIIAPVLVMPQLQIDAQASAATIDPNGANNQAAATIPVH